MVEVLIESTREFEKDIEKLSQEEKANVIKKINHYANLFPTQKNCVYDKLEHLPLLSELKGYDSSVYILRITPKLRVILAIDEDPIFEQIIFTLFRVVKQDEINQGYQSLAESLYQELLHNKRETALIS